MTRTQILTLSFLFVLGALAVSPFVPKTVGAQSYTYTNCGSYYSSGNCGLSTLRVWLDVRNSPVGQQLQAKDFAVTVTSNSGSPVTFAGSSNGISVPVIGHYTVSVASMSGYVASYETGCENLVNTSGQNLTCTVHLTSTAAYTAPALPYNPYPSAYAPTLSCTPASQTVSLGQNVVLTVGGTSAGPFTWNVDDHTYQSGAPVLSTTFNTSGTRRVTVSNGALSATCQVTVLASTLPVTTTTYTIPTNPTYPTYPTNYATNYSGVVAPAYAPSYPPAPKLPNTGYGPLSTTQIVLMISLLSAASLAVLPYVRKTFASLG